MKKKLNIRDLQVTSFVTGLELKGGGTGENTDYKCRTDICESEYPACTRLAPC